jgi:hypothetical protein
MIFLTNISTLVFGLNEGKIFCVYLAHWLMDEFTLYCYFK